MRRHLNYINGSLFVSIIIRPKAVIILHHESLAESQLVRNAQSTLTKTFYISALTVKLSAFVLSA